MLQSFRIITALIVSGILLVSVATAGQGRAVEDLSATADKLLQLVQRMQDPLPEGAALADLRRQLIPQVENLQACRLLLNERFRSREFRLQNGNSTARARHQEFSALLDERLQNINAMLLKIISQTDINPRDLDDLSNSLKQLVPAKQVPLHGAVPYRQLQFQIVAPRIAPEISPAYLTSTIDTVSADLQGTSEAPLSQAIYQQASIIAETVGKQNWDPVDLYEWVKNNIRTEWYWGSMKGAEETLRQRSGNDADQAALLIALLRAAGYPSRYVRGTVEFFPDLDMARRLTGIDDAVRIGEFFRKAGIPHQPVLNGSEIVNYQLEHIWIETLIPYANYRGSLADMHGKLWLPLDTSFKVTAFTEKGILDLYDQPGQPLSTLRDDYLDAVQDKTPIEVLREQVDTFLAAQLPDVQYNSILHHRIQQPENLHILSTAPQFTEVAVTAEYTSLPDELIHKVRITAVDADTGTLPVFDITLPVSALSNQQLHITYEPDSVEDQETINLWGGLDNTPAYLVHLRPVLVVDGTRIVVGQQGFAVGKNFTLQVAMQSPAGAVAVENSLVVGYPHLLGIVAQDVTLADTQTPPDSAVDFLYQTALDYIDRWNRDEQEIADLLDLKIARPLPSLVSLGGMMAVTELLGQPQSVSWTGLFLDADFRSVEAVARGTTTDNRLLSFMQLSALQGSALEHQLLEEHFQIESISTAKLFSLAHAASVPILTINAENISTALLDLGLSQNVEVDISTAVAAGMIVQIPAQPLAYQAWVGTGYLKESIETGESGYMLSGLIAGGNTVLGKTFWPEDLAARMVQPYQGAPNSDVLAAHSLTSITPWQIRQATAGEELTDPLMVLVKDESGVPVVGAPVIFTVNKGDGMLIDDTSQPEVMTQSFTVISDFDGIARARFVPGASVYINPIVIARPEDEQANLAGENLIAAQLVTGSLAALNDPIIALGFAGQPDLSQSQILGDGRIGDVLSYAGNAGVLLQDRFGNPVANHPVEFTLQSVVIEPTSACGNALPDAEYQSAEIFSADDPCLKQLPVHGECVRAAESVTLKSRSDGSAMVGVVLGGMADADYPIVASLQTSEASISQLVINQHTAANGACGVASQPVEKLVLTYPRLMDAEGRNIDARLVGEETRLNIKSYLLSEGTVQQENAEVVACSPSPDLSCDQMVGNGDFAITVSDMVTGNSMELQRVATMPDSTVMPYLYGLDMTLAAGLNQVPLTATASHTRPVINNDCSGCVAESQEQTIISTAEEIIELWGISIQLPDVMIAPVDDHGRLVRDTIFSYRILPAEYVAGMAQVLIYADGDLWESILSPTSGVAQLTIPAGYTFLANKNYEIQILLGSPGDANAIYSDKIPIMPVISTVDLHVDGLPDVVEDQVGAFVLLNNDYDERDHDASISLLDVETPTMIRNDDELKRAWLHIDDADMLGGSWQVKANDSSQLRIYYEHGGEFLEMKAEHPPQPITETPLTIPLYLEGLAESAGLHSNDLTLIYVSSQGTVISDSMPLTVVHFDMAVDGNRDRDIDFVNKEDESALFWVNNDHDVESFSPEDKQNVEDDAEIGNDSLDNEIPCWRDLEDFARLQVKFGSAVLPGQLSFTVKTEGFDGQNVPMLNLFPAADLTTDYLGVGEDVSATAPDTQLIQEMIAAVGSELVSIPNIYIASNKVAPFVYEGRNSGQGRLLLTANYNGVPVLQREIELALYNINYFYDHYVVEKSDGTEISVNSKVNSVGVTTNASREALYQPSSHEYVMFVHGWNVEPWKKKRWAETVFKRLWWQGYEGRVGLFDWPCRIVPSWDLPINYDRSEHLAWLSAVALKELMVDINRESSGQMRLLAHSQGNVVAGEAINLSEPGVVHAYIASQAALSSSFYEPVLANIQPQLGAFTKETPDVIASYPVDPELKPYLKQVSSKVNLMFSYFNINDYALTGDNDFSPRWEVNNKTKPDDFLSYGYQGDPEIFPPLSPDIGFYQTRWIDVDGEKEAYKYQLSFPDKSYEIFSFAAESRSRALGAVHALPAFAPESLTLAVKGSRDLSETDYNNKRYSHSRQFRSNIVDEQFYWRSFVVDMELSNNWDSSGE